MKTTSCFVLALGLVASAAASAVTLTDVRVGVHRDHTRIVLETDAKAPYIVDAGEKEIIVHVDAAATAEAVTAKSPHLIWAKVEPTAIGADVRLSLKQPADVKAMVLTGPDRIVLDLYPKKGAAEPLPAPELIPEEAPPPVTAEAAPPAPAPTREEPTLPAETPSPSEPEPVAGAEQAPAPAAEPGEPPAAEGETAPETPEAEEPEAPAPPEAEELAAQPEAAPEATPEEAPAPPTTPLAPAPSRNPLRSPVLLSAIAALLFAFFLFLRRRLRGAEKARIREWSPGEEPPVLPGEGAASAGFGPAAGESVFDVEPEALSEPPKEEEEPLPALRRAQPDAEDETERRIAHLERRIEELVDARERLERQLAAQTEELRVQRAAIARTQRVLRSVAPRSEDEPSSEPVRS